MYKKKEETLKEIESLKAEIVNNSTDKEKAKSLLNDLITKHDYVCNGFKLVDIPMFGDEETINKGGIYTITRNRLATVFHVNGYDYVMRKDGYDVVLKNYLKSAHVPFDTLFYLNKKKNEEGLTEGESAVYDVLLVCVVYMCQIMNIASTSEHRQAMLKILVEKWFQEISEELDKKLENPEGDDISVNDILNLNEDAEGK